jgi:hypothetical protein
MKKNEETRLMEGVERRKGEILVNKLFLMHVRPKSKNDRVLR